jgi:membrane protein YqaA with SNARE-associated domain
MTAHDVMLIAVGATIGSFLGSITGHAISAWWKRLARQRLVRRRNKYLTGR